MSVDFRSLVPGGFYSSAPFAPDLKVSIRTNNPGALNVAPWIKAYPGYVGDKVTSDTTGKGGGANSTVIFETPEQGVAAWWELMRKYADGGANTVGGIVNRYGGGQDYQDYVSTVTRWTGTTPGERVDLNDDKTLLLFAKAMFRYEAGVVTPLKDEQILLGFKIGRNKGVVVVAAPVSKGWMALFGEMLERFSQMLDKAAGKGPSPDLASRLVAAMRHRNFRIDTAPGQINVLYVEGMGPNGVKNDNTPNQFNDARFAIAYDGRKAKLLGAWEATTEPSRRWTVNPMNPAGAARIKFGQYPAWQLGEHHGHEALVQTGGPVTVFRDANKDFKRDGDKEDTGYFGINQHWGYDLPHNDLGASSAGCLVGRMKTGHREFMALVKSDPRFIANERFVFTAAVLPASEV